MDSGTSAPIAPLLRVGMVAVLVGVAVFGFGSPAAAKGPESASITDPWDGRPIELMCDGYSDPVVRLMRHTGVYGLAGVRPLEEPPGELGPGHALTWVNSGPPDRSRDERTIRSQVLYLDAEGGVVIYDPAREASELPPYGGTSWFAASDAVRDALVELGVPMSAAEAATFSDHECGRASWHFAAVALVLLSGLAWGTRRLRGARELQLGALPS